jgi:hypothetical protein
MTFLPVSNPAIRPDNPEGFGPLPNTEAYAEIFNQLSTCINLLDKARVPLPARMKGTTQEVTGTADVSGSCTRVDYGKNGWLYEGTPPAAGTDAGTNPFDDLSFVASAGAQLDSSLHLLTSGEITTYSFHPISDALLFAVPESWIDLVETGLGCFCRMTHTIVIPEKTVVDPAAAESCDDAWGPHDPFWVIGGIGYQFVDGGSTVITCAGVATSGTITHLQAPAGAFAYGLDIGSTTPCGTHSGESTQITIIDGDTTFVKIPLVN